MKNYKHSKKSTAVLNDKKLFKNFVPRTKDKKGNTIEQGYFIVSDEELASIVILNKALK